MRKLLLAFLLPLLLLNNSCAGKLPPNATAADKTNFLRLEIVTAVNDAVDGIIAAHTATWLNDNDTVLVLKAFHVALETVKTSQDPKTAVMSAITDIKRQLSASSVVRWNPYLDSLSSVIGAF